MGERQVRLTFQPQGRSVFVLPGTKLLEAAGRAGLTVDTPCGGGGTCGKCRVQIAAGPPQPTEVDRRHFSDEELAAGWRLACQTAVDSEATIHVPTASLFADQHQILAEAAEPQAAELAPAVRKIYLQLPASKLQDEQACLASLAEQLGRSQADPDLLRNLAGKLQLTGSAGTAVLANGKLIDFEPGDTTARCYGVAIDLGTTTLAGSLLDLISGDELAVASGINPQTGFGDDVLSRIKYASAGADEFSQLQRCVTGAIGRILDDLCGQAGVARSDICELTFAGNTTMQHLLAGLDVRSLGQVPFAPVVSDSLIVPAERLGIAIHAGGPAYVFPVIGGFVGGDTVAGVLATQLAQAADGPVLMIDIGTNGEIVLAHEGRLWAASTAAGPAFEGARISCGMRATAGAIEKVIFDGDVRCSVIADAEPVGLCGSGLVDAAAELLAGGIVSPTGRLLGPDQLPSELPDAIRRRVLADDAGRVRFVLAHDGPDGPVALTEADIRELQLAVGAIRAGVTILLSRAGIAGPDLQAVLVAGGFGSFIRRSNAQRIGLLPADVDRNRIRYVGNASLDGARWALLSRNVRDRAEQIARRAEHVQLSADERFQMIFAESMMFPS